jgi:hypothetical protein
MKEADSIPGGSLPDMIAEEIAISLSLEEQCYLGIRGCLMGRFDRPTIDGEWYSVQPLTPDVKYAELLAKATHEAIGKPNLIKRVLSGHENVTLMTGMGVRMAKVRQGVVGLAPIIDCLGIYVGSQNSTGRSLITAAHIGLADGYSMDDVDTCIAHHEGAKRLGIAVVGCGLNPEMTAEFRTKQDIWSSPDRYKTKVRELLGSGVIIDRTTIRIKQDSPYDVARGKYKTYAVFGDTNYPSLPNLVTYTT